ncbi:hypothetical protein POTOM_034409 [Populus tomentosa]|uniref:Uncharacterized protein n=1 Tax=Populus tomentosa TaxID=118781 RepID=A0A8X7Z6Z5_POPTO|nr:hypothetical protein POTOM_034409 [Populus tomentosa]
MSGLTRFPSSAVKSQIEEALLLRDVKSTGEKSLQASYLEWLNFDRHSLDNGFYSIAIQSCEKSLACFEKNDIADTKTGEFFENAQIIEEIKRFKDRDVKSAASRSGIFMLILEANIIYSTCHVLLIKIEVQTREHSLKCTAGYFNRCCKEESLLGLSNLVFEIHKLQRNKIKLVEIVDAMEW